MEKRVSKMITKQEDIDYLLSIKEPDITTSFIMNNFGDFGNGPRFNPYDLIEVPVGAYGGTMANGKERKNKNKFTTGVGRLIFNKFFFESDPVLLQFFPYTNDNVTSKTYEKILNQMGYLMLEGKIDTETYKKFCKKSQKMMPYVSILAPNHSDNMLTITKRINKKKAQLLKEHKAELDAKDDNSVKVFDQISNELLDYAKDLMKDDPAMDMFNSGAGGSFGNNFKNMFIMRGAVKDPTPNKGYNMITSNYIDGISKEEYSAIANTLAAGPYARSKKTEVGGYWETKLLIA